MAFTQPEWNTIGTVKDGFAQTSIMVRYPDGNIVPVSVPTGTTARAFALIIDAEDGYTVQAVRVTVRPGVQKEVSRR